MTPDLRRERIAFEAVLEFAVARTKEDRCTRFLFIVPVPELPGAGLLAVSRGETMPPTAFMAVECEFEGVIGLRALHESDCDYPRARSGCRCPILCWLSEGMDEYQRRTTN